MNRIEIRGIIVPSIYDSDGAQKYIEKGVITPESVFRKALLAARTDEDLELYINSVGGSVFAGSEMINAIQEWKKNSGRKCNVTVGAMAASMAAVMTIFAGDTVKVHQNSKIMFHGASTVTEGGAEAHKDEADLLEKINNDCKVQLLAKYKLQPETVDEWFAEGRAGWLTAEESVKIGLASEIIGANAMKVQTSPNAMTMLSDHGMKIAAVIFAETEFEQIQEETQNANIPGGKTTSAPTEEHVPSQSGVPAVPQVPAVTPSDCDAAYDEGLAAGKAEAEATFQRRLTDELAKFAQKKDAEILVIKTELEAEKAKSENLLNSQNSLRLEFSALEMRHKNFLGGAFDYQPDQPISDWKSALEKCGGDYVVARKKYPDQYKQFMKGNKR